MEEYFSINSDDHFGSMFSSLHTLQKQGALCDVILAAEDGEVMAHKVLLMAASSYFRERLSQTISGTASRIYLKGISVMELANLVKYIYTGKLFVSKDTVDITLEISEILGLDGVIKGYNDILHMQTLRSKNKEATEDISLGQDLSMADGQDRGKEPESKLPNSGSKLSACGEIHHNSKEIKVLQYNADGTSTTYTVPQPGTSEVSSTTGEGNFEFQQLCQQYVEVPAGSSVQQPHPIGSPYAGVPSLETVVIDEEAQHQDLLSVAIKKLSDASSSNLDDECTSGSTEDNSNAKKAATKKEEKYVNGKIDTKIVTLSAGKISNELGGHTSVYTVALDPSTIKQPLKMPRVMRKKTDKEKLAEQNAKRYRQKKAELIAAKVHPVSKTDTEQEHDPVDIYSHQPNIVVQVKDMNEHLVVEAAQEVLMFHESLEQPQSALRLEPYLNIPSSGEPMIQDENELFVGQPQGTVQDVVISNNVTVEQCEAGEHFQEDFGCSVNFDSDDNGEDINSKVVKISDKEDMVNDSLKQIEENTKQLNAKPDSVEAEIVTVPPLQTDNLINCSSDVKDLITENDIEIIDVNTLPEESKLESSNTKDLHSNSAETPDKSHERLIGDLEKSSASKRKLKAPKRLSLIGNDKTADRNIPIVRTRRSSRNEGSPKEKPASSGQTNKIGTATKAKDIKQRNSLGYIKSIKVCLAQRDHETDDQSDKKLEKGKSEDETNTSDSDIDVLNDTNSDTESGLTKDLRSRKGSKRQSEEQVTRPRKALRVGKRYTHDNNDVNSQSKECINDKEMSKESPVSTRTSARLLSKKSEMPDAQGILKDSRDESSPISRDDPNQQMMEPEEIKQELNTEEQNMEEIPGKYECSYCDFFTLSKGVLKTHTMLKHNKQKDFFPCKFCEYSTPLIGNLRKHMLSIHHLTVVGTKKARFSDFEEGTLLTLDGAVFDPKTMSVPKVSKRCHNKDEVTKKIGRKVKKEKSNLLTLSNEDFTKEILKRHEEYLKQPEKIHKVMSKSLAVATAHPSFPQASPSVRVNKANKLYHTPKVSHLVAGITDSSSHYVQMETVDSSIPSVEQEVEIQGQHLNRGLVQSGGESNEFVLTLPDGAHNKTDEIVVTVQDNGNGKLIPIQFLIDNHGDKGASDVVNVLLEEEQIQVHDEVEIQNE